MLHVFPVSLKLASGLPNLGHLGAATNRDGHPIHDCYHWCLDTAPVVRAWVVLLLESQFG